MTIKLANSDESPSTTTMSSDNNSQQQQQQPKEEVEATTATLPSDDALVAAFPVDDLQRLDEMLNRTRWIVPVLPKNELETLLDAAIALCRHKVDTKSEPCQRFFRDALSVSFMRVLGDEAVGTWKLDIYVILMLL